MVAVLTPPDIYSLIIIIIPIFVIIESSLLFRNIFKPLIPSQEGINIKFKYHVVNLYIVQK